LRLRALNKWWNAHAAPHLPPWFDKVCDDTGMYGGHRISFYMLLDAMDWPTQLPNPHVEVRMDRWLGLSIMFRFWWRGLAFRIALTKDDACVLLSARYEQKWGRHRWLPAPNIILYRLSQRHIKQYFYEIYMVDGLHSHDPDQIEFIPLRRALQLRHLFIDELDVDTASRSFVDWLLPDPLERLICSTPASLTREFFHDIAFSLEIPTMLDKWPDTPQLSRSVQPEWNGVTLINTY
jgi:hypothetical protein